MIKTETHFIIFPSGDRNKIDIVTLNDSVKHDEICDYALASRHEFREIDDAIEYAKELAHKNKIKYVGEDSFLD